jgi:hypothetical protein
MKHLRQKGIQSNNGMLKKKLIEIILGILL